VSPEYDVVCAGWAKGVNEVYAFLHKFKLKFGKCVKSEQVAFYTYMKHFTKRWLDAQERKEAEPPRFGKTEKAGIDQKDWKILGLLSENARARTVDIAGKVGLAETAVRARMRKMEAAGVLAGYKVLLDYEKLGMLYFWVHCGLRNHGAIDAIERAVGENRNVVYIDRAVGGSDLEFGVQYAGTRELERYIEELRAAFPEAIREIEYLTVLKNIRLKYLPEKAAV
jgi:Lrp/AsnC family leucine-responsive transcriptional regulator